MWKRCSKDTGRVPGGIKVPQGRAESFNYLRDSLVLQESKTQTAVDGSFLGRTLKKGFFVQNSLL